MDKFNKKNILELRKLSVDEIDKYFRELRKYEFETGKELTEVEYRKKIHGLMLSLLKLDRILLQKEKLTILSDKRIKHNKPVIFAATHIGGNDVVRVFEAVKEHAYLLLGDPGIIYVNELGLFLNLNGYLAVDTRDKTDRNIVYKRSVEVLNKGANLIIFPEGAYNVFENLPVMNIYPGAVNMAKETGSEIIPLAIEQYDKNFIVNIGENIKVTPDIPTKEANQYLRDILATLKLEIWESQEIAPRESYTDEYINNFRQSIVDRDEYGEYVYILSDIYETMYHDKSIITAEEVFAPILNAQKKLIYSPPKK
ncbi:MAG: 1-acyl-sn-glycerol-3-phosphate acyltransferase [Bacilli bacterium]|nr:1-acyl-sn-glycerol-3-phosphate acyltransferase [Bacilli bacterium]